MKNKILNVCCVLLLGVIVISCYNYDGASREFIVPEGIVLNNTEYSAIEANWKVLEIPLDSDTLGSAEFVTNAPQGGGEAIKLNMRISVTSVKKLPRNYRLEFKFLLENNNGWFGVRPTDEKGPYYQAERNEYHSACFGFAPVFFYKGTDGWTQAQGNGYGFTAGDFGSWELGEKPTGNNKSFTPNTWYTVVIQSIMGSHKMTVTFNNNVIEEFSFASPQNSAAQYLSFATGTWGGAASMFIKDIKF